MIDHATGFIHTIAGAGLPSDTGDVGDGGPAMAARLNMPSDVAIAPNGDVYIADMHHQRVRKVDARTRRITTVAGTGGWGNGGDGGLATEATLAGPAGIAVTADAEGRLLLFIADYYNARVRAVGADGIIRDVGAESNVTFGAPTRVAVAPQRGTVWVTDSYRDRLVALTIRALQPPQPSAPAATTRAAARRPGSAE
jgi:DNA-binding beta-propeller fold protein YncE